MLINTKNQWSIQRLSNYDLAHPGVNLPCQPPSWRSSPARPALTPFSCPPPSFRCCHENHGKWDSYAGGERITRCSEVLHLVFNECQNNSTLSTNMPIFVPQHINRTSVQLTLECPPCKKVKTIKTDKRTSQIYMIYFCLKLYSGGHIPK